MMTRIVVIGIERFPRGEIPGNNAKDRPVVPGGLLSSIAGTFYSAALGKAAAGSISRPGVSVDGAPPLPRRNIRRKNA